jgi:glycosyltransferase involved in cell wall biosynthesis
MVKNEEQVIERMLSSAKQGARFLFICDTGSSDGTLAIVERVWRKNYRIYQTNFTNFETTRNECNAHARIYLKDMRSLGVSLEYVLLADADFVYVERSPPPPPKGGAGESVATLDINIIQIHAGVSGHPHNSLNMLIKYDTFIHCRYRLWTHEYLDCSAAPGNISIGHYTHFYYVDYADGKSRPEKLTRDARLLEQWLLQVNETDLRPRALYYLARAYEDSGQLEKAMRTYEQHNAVQVFTNYQFYAKYRMALITMQQMYNKLNTTTTDAKISAAALHNADVNVERAFMSALSEHDGYFRQEPLYWLARYFRQRGQLNKCIIYATAGLHLPSIDHDRMPLFLETQIQEWALREELVYCLKLKGRQEENVIIIKE